MKITFVLPAVPTKPRGGYRIIFEYANYLASHGDQIQMVYLIDQSLKKYHIPEGIRKRSLSMLTSIEPRWFRLNKKIVRKGIATVDKLPIGDCIIATAIRTAAIVHNADDNCGKKAYLIQDYEHWAADDTTILNSFSYGMKNITVSRWLKELVDEHALSPSICISNPIDTSIFHKKDVNRIKHSITFHYRSGLYKGAIYAVEIIEKLKTMYSDLHVTIVSSEKKSEQIPSWCKYIYKASIETVATVDNESEIFLCTSINEGFGLPGLEAMACGCALVSFDYPGVHEYAIPDFNSVIVKSKDVDGAVNAIIRLFDNKETLTRISENAVQTASSHTIENSAKAFQDVLYEYCNVE